jgi:ribokinase
MSVLKPLVVVGSINTDLVVTAKRLPQRGETIPGTSFHTYQGGKGANQAVAAALLGANVIMVGKVGSDAFGAESIRQLQERGVDCSHVMVEPGDSGLAVITVGAAGENTILVIPGANAAVTPEFVESRRAVIREAGMVMTQLEIPMAAVLRVAEICNEEKVPLMLDPAPAQKVPEALFGLCQWITPNETEAAFYAGEQGTNEEMKAALIHLGAKGVVLKMGERGAALYDREVAVTVAPFPVAAVDTTAAGDTFNGALAAALLTTDDLKKAGRSAAAAAALSVTRMGAQASMPSAAEVETFLEQRSR